MSHEHVRYGDQDSGECVALAEDVCIRPWRTLDGHVTFMIAHERATPFDPARHASQPCEGRVPTGPDGWAVVGSLEGGDLTLSPSVLCVDPGGVCGGSHGFVRDGKWVPA